VAAFAAYHLKTGFQQHVLRFLCRQAKKLRQPELPMKRS
jgi:hypothetical protein